MFKPAAAFSGGPVGQFRQQGAGGSEQGFGFSFKGPRQRQAERLGDPPGRRQHEPGRPHEGIQFKDIEGGKRADAEPFSRRFGVADDGTDLRPGTGGQTLGSLGQGRGLDFSIRGQPRRPADPGDEGRLGGKHQAWGSGGVVHGGEYNVGKRGRVKRMR
jgi:hypothetical protein